MAPQSQEIPTLRIPRPISAKLNLQIGKLGPDTSVSKAHIAQNKSINLESKPVMSSLPITNPVK